MGQAGLSPEAAVTRSIRVLADEGYLETTVEQLAHAAGISRATFFRKYGSKEDMVFADHAATLERLDLLLQRPGLTPQAGLVEGARLVFRHHLDHPERAVARHDLLQSVESLRDREIAMSSRYERVFQAFLRRALPGSADRRVTAVALAASTVAVHNAFLRTWLRDPGPASGEQLVAALSERVAWLCSAFGVGVSSTARGFPADVTFLPPEISVEFDDDAARRRSGGPSPVVVVVPQGADPAVVAERTARSVYEALKS
ncbi:MULTISPECIES: TetR/AcrR family transcriptional regulator [Kocuria]|uniref:TetR/AcrR family transcriptional regulator n=1 Tax=Kocuria TaxID=57493 RepID=UPI0006D7C089|nr:MULTISPECIES: TetR/AcrR family transcriptional regulator [Kocuria]MDN5630690.1 TetR/AcrR family transcriptional regulator [Kocuria sp.]